MFFNDQDGFFFIRSKCFFDRSRCFLTFLLGQVFCKGQDGFSPGQAVFFSPGQDGGNTGEEPGLQANT